MYVKSHIPRACYFYPIKGIYSWLSQQNQVLKVTTCDNFLQITWMCSSMSYRLWKCQSLEVTFQGHIYCYYVDHHITQIPEWYPGTYCTPFILLFSSQIVDYLVTNKVIEYIQHSFCLISFCLFTLIQAVVNWTLENQSNPIEPNLWSEFNWLTQFNQIKHRIFCLFDFQTNQTRSHKLNWTEPNTIH